MSKKDSVVKLNEQQLVDLHSLIATVLTSQLKEQYVDSKGKKYYAATPALLRVALELIKHNDITLDKEDRNMNALLQQLEKLENKRKEDNKTKVSTIPIKTANTN